MLFASVGTHTPYILPWARTGDSSVAKKALPKTKYLKAIFEFIDEL
jgi:hypothetical protein